jgi:hypothetical protein
MNKRKTATRNVNLLFISHLHLIRKYKILFRDARPWQTERSNRLLSDYWIYEFFLLSPRITRDGKPMVFKGKIF